MGVLADIAGQTQPIETLFTSAGVAPQLIAAANLKRYALGFGPQGGPGYSVTTRPEAGATPGIILPGSGLVWLTVKDHGAFVQADWWLVNAGVGQTVAVFELVLPRE